MALEIEVMHTPPFGAIEHVHALAIERGPAPHRAQHLAVVPVRGVVRVTDKLEILSDCTAQVSPALDPGWASTLAAEEYVLEHVPRDVSTENGHRGVRRCSHLGCAPANDVDVREEEVEEDPATVRGSAWEAMG